MISTPETPCYRLFVGKTNTSLTKNTGPKSLAGYNSQLLKEIRAELRQLVKERPTIGRLDAKQQATRDRMSLCLLTAYALGGYSVGQLAEELKMPAYTVRDYIARGRHLTFDNDSREHLRQVIVQRLDEMYQVALDSGDLTEARLCNEALGKFVGLVSTGGNTLNIGVNVGGTQLDERIEKWMAEQAVLEGEVVEVGDEAAAGGAVLAEGTGQDAGAAEEAGSGAVEHGSDNGRGPE